jgi:hypothetical protein
MVVVVVVAAAIRLHQSRSCVAAALLMAFDRRVW